MTSVGTSVARKEGMDRATGAAKYADDLRFPGMLVGRTVRSTIPLRIGSVDSRGGSSNRREIAVTHHNIPPRPG